MESMYMVKKAEVNMEYLETGEGNHMTLQDVFGKAQGAPFTFGMAEILPSEGIEFDYDDDGAICICLEGTISLTDKATGKTSEFAEGDIVYIPQEKGKVIVWNSTSYTKFAYATYPHWR